MTEQPPIETIVRDSNRVARAEVQALVGELRAGGDAAWNAPTACKGWAAKDVVAHVAGAIYFFSGATHAALDGQPTPPFDAGQAQAAAAELLAQPAPAVLNVLAERNEDFCEYLDSLDVAALPTAVPLGFMTLPVWQVAVARLNEVAIHCWDVRVVREASARIQPDAVPLLVPGNVELASVLAQGEKTTATWLLDVDGPAGGPVTVRVQGDQVAIERGAAPSPDARLALDGEALLRLLWGRLDLGAAIDSGQVRLDGDRAKALALQRLFPGV